MASITIRRLDESLKTKLRVRAANHGRSMEEEAREILRVSLASSNERESNLATAIRRHIEPLGGIDLKLSKRSAIRQPPDFSK